MQFTPIYAALITASVMVISALITYLNAYLNRISERTKLTRDLYMHFFSMLEDRNSAFFWLEKQNNENQNLTFETIWRSESGNAVSLYKVLAFWSILYRLYLAKQLDMPLAAILFGYEFFHWHEIMIPLVESTDKHNKIFPSVLQPFESRKWLLTDESFSKAARFNGVPNGKKH